MYYRGGLFINFRPITLEDKPLFDRYFQQRRYENAHMNFTNLFMWRTLYNIQWTLAGEALLMKAAWNDKEFALMPVAPPTQLANVVDTWLDYFQGIGQPFKMRGVERFMMEEMERLRPGYFSFAGDRDNYDYVYPVQDLIDLKGRKYHSKKNHINSFYRTYGESGYLPLCEALAPDCIATLIEWCEKRGCDNDPILRSERDAIIEVLNCINDLSIKGGVILLNDKVEAFTFGEQINDDTAVIHVEKGNPDIRGIYPVINQSFCRYEWSGLTYVNREEDMGLEGLRKAKESYGPVKMIEKFVVTVNVPQ